MTDRLSRQLSIREAKRRPRTRPTARRHRLLRGEFLEERNLLAGATDAAASLQPWRNPLNPLDVDGSKSVSPTDAVLIINYLNSNRPAQLPAEYTPPAPYYDVDGTGRVSPTDAVLVINALNVAPANPSDGNGGLSSTAASGCSLVVTTTADSGLNSLREAIQCANSAPGADTITFGGVFSDTSADVIHLTSGELLVGSDLTIQAPGASLLKLSGNSARRVLRVAAGTTAALIGLTIADGNGVGGGPAGSGGGGIYNEGALTLRNVVVSGNRTGGPGVSPRGGGIQNNDGTLILIQSTVDNNFAQGASGGIDNDGGSVTLINSTLSNNTCSEGAGGVGNFNGGTLAIFNSTISGNYSGLFGGGIANSSGTLVVTNSTVTGNGSYNARGGISTLSNTTLRNSIVAGNYRGGSGLPVFPSDIEHGTIDTATNNLIGDAGTAGNLVHDADDNPATGSNNIVGNNGTGTIPIGSVIGPLADNGGPTKTHDLVHGSPAINRGSNTHAVDAQNQPLTTDQRGVGFARIVNTVVDIGAFEFVPAPIGPLNAVDDDYTTAEDTVLTVPAPGVLGNDIRPDTATLTAVLDSGALHGTVNLNPTLGSFTYSPVADFSGTDRFTYHVTDGSNSSGKATVTITVTPVNDPPSGSDKVVATLENTPYVFILNDVFLSDSRDVPANSLQAVRIASLPASGSLIHNSVPVVVGQFIPAVGIASGGLRYIPPVNGIGNALARFTFQLQDDGGTVNGGVDLDPTPNTITINVMPVNDAPVAVADAFSAAEDTPLLIAAPGILANDSDADAGDTMTVVAINGPTARPLWDESINGDLPGTFGQPPVLTLQPGRNEVRGTTGQPATGSGDFDHFVIHVPDDAQVTSVTWSVSRAVGALGGVSWEVYAGAAFPATRLTTDSIGVPANEAFAGLALPLGPGYYLFRESSFTHASGVVPSLGAYTFRFQLSRDLSVGVPLSLASGARLTANTDGSFVYDPQGQFNWLGVGQTATDSFTYTIADREGSESSATVNVTIQGTNDPPVAAADAYQTQQDIPLSIGLTGVLSNDQDIDEDSLVAVLKDGPALGTVTLNSNGSFTYTPAPGYSGPDSFTYRASDGMAVSNVATVTIHVHSINRAPLASNDDFTLDEDIPFAFPAPGLLANDMDPDGDVLTAELLTGPANGTLVLSATGAFSYVPSANFFGTDSFTYRTTDGETTSNIATVTLTVTPVDDAPAALDDTYTVAEDAALNVPEAGVLINDSDLDGDTLSAALQTGTAHGTLTLFTDGTFSYQPAANFHGADSFTYRTSDLLSQSDPATVTLNVTPLNDPPVALGDGYAIAQDTRLDLPAPGVLANDSDLDGDSLSAVIASGPANGTLSLGASGGFSYQPEPGFVGADSFAYRASDGSLESSAATVLIDVQPAVATSWTAQLLKDINVAAGGVQIHGNSLVDFQGAAYFAGSVGGGDIELWRSDGSTAGTRQVRDIRVGPEGSRPTNLTVAGGLLFFAADDGAGGYELWTSDGTESGTLLVKEIQPGVAGSYPRNLANVNGTLFFAAGDGASGYELWKSDGTFPGTVLVRDIAPGISNSNPQSLTNVNGTLLFVANDGTNGYELWKSDGTPTGTMLVKDVRPGVEAFPLIRELTNVNGTLLFRHDDGEHGAELWKSDGTEAGTLLVKDIQPGVGGSQLQSLTTVGTKLFFIATNAGFSANTLWMSDGTAAGTVALTLPEQITPGPWHMTAVNDLLFFFGGTGLWTSDGTADGTTRIRHVATSGTSPAGRYLVNVNGTLLFTAMDGDHGRELWKSDGTAAGTLLVTDTISGPEGGSPRLLTNVGGRLFFAAGDGVGGTELWTSDGTADGGSRVVIGGGVTASAAPSAAVIVGNVAYFSATDADGGRELWKTNGTAAGTVRVADIVPGPSGSSPRYLTNVNGTLFFTADDAVHGRELWKSDGTAAGTVRVKDIRPGIFPSTPRELENVAGVLFFAANDGTSGYELWRSDGTEGGTTLVADIREAGSSDPRSLTNVSGTLFFRANDGVSGGELWKSDGTEVGTALVRDIQSGLGSSFPTSLTNVNGTLFFAAAVGGMGVELWKSDGTSDGTTLVRDIRPGSSSGLPRYLTEMNGGLFFRASDAASGGELWQSDGTFAGTELVRDIRPGANDALPAYLTNVGGTLFFTATSSGDNFELWKSDGTPGGTQLVAEIIAGPVGSFPSLLTNVGGRLFFAADSDNDGRELWTSDGTPGGTFQIANIGPGDASSLPADITDFFGRVLFTADDRLHGREMWIAFDAATNHAPIAAPDGFSTAGNGPLTISAPGLLANDFDADGDALSARLIAGPGQGVLALEADGSFRYTPPADFRGVDSFTYRAGDGVAESAPVTVTISIDPQNAAPAISLVGGSSVHEGSVFIASGSFTDPDSSTWTATVDYGDGGGPQVLALTAANTFALSHVYVDNGEFDITVVIEDNEGAAQTATLIARIDSAPPQNVTFSGPAQAARGQTVTFAGTFTDAGIADSHIARIQWGDGTFSQFTVSGAGGVRQFSATHVYQVGGVFQPTVRITDDDGGAAVAQAELLVSGSRLKQGVLEIVGSSQADSVTVAYIRGGIEVFGSIGGITVSQSFAPSSVERIVALLGSGNDTMMVSSTVAVPVMIDGGNGADTIMAGSGPAIILGGSGNDAIRGGGQRDLIIGGFGADQINASSGGDILISGRTSYDADFAALEAILAEWSAVGTYQERVDRLRSGSGGVVQPLGIKLTHGETVFDDTVADTLWGGSELDWFFFDPSRDQPLDKLASEVNR